MQQRSIYFLDVETCKIVLFPLSGKTYKYMENLSVILCCLLLFLLAVTLNDA